MKNQTYLFLMFSCMLCRGEATEHQLFWSPGFNSSIRFSSIHQSESTTYISGFKNPIDATSDGQKVYFTNGGSFYSLDFGATVAIELFSFSDHSISPNSIAIHDGTLFVADSTKIYRSSLSNIEFQTIVENPDGYISDLVVDGINLYWSDEDGGIFRASISGGSRITVVHEAQSPMSITFFNDRLYWTKDGDEQIRSVNKDGTGESLVIDLESGIPDSISMAANRIWWSDVARDEIYSCRLDGSDLKEVSLSVFSPSGLAWVFPNTETGEAGIGSLEVKKISIGENGLGISWNARTGNTYSVLASEDLSFSDPPLTSIEDFEFFHTGIFQTAERQFYVIAEE